MMVGLYLHHGYLELRAGKVYLRYLPRYVVGCGHIYWNQLLPTFTHLYIIMEG